jgi:aminoglycoside phosphotransferase (APT) family kinase protein
LIPDLQKLGAISVISEEDPDHPYLIMERLSGEPYGKRREKRSLGEECALVSQVAAMVRALHETPTEGLQSFGRAPGEWVRRIQARAALWEEYLALSAACLGRAVAGGDPRCAVADLMSW